MVSTMLSHEDLRRMRQRARITQRDIANRLEISDTSVSDFESGEKPLPFALTSEDYLAALKDAISDKEAGR